jgi:hypothetical protein
MPTADTRNIGTESLTFFLWVGVWGGGLWVWHGKQGKDDDRTLDSGAAIQCAGARGAVYEPQHEMGGTAAGNQRGVCIKGDMVWCTL